jgi:hypothetical protein
MPRDVPSALLFHPLLNRVRLGDRAPNRALHRLGQQGLDTVGNRRALAHKD